MPLTVGTAVRRLEDLDRVAGGVVDEDLSTARAADDIVAEAEAGGAEALDLGVDVVDDEVDVSRRWRAGPPSCGPPRGPIAFSLALA
jgi:hypothetical protein